MALVDNEELVQQPVEEVVETPVEEPPKIPEKYSGKSLEDIVHMHQEAEKLIGRQAQEVGEVRRLADELLKQKISQNTQPVEEEIDFFENPKKAVQRAVDTHPDILAAREAAVNMRAMQTQNMLTKKHPDFGDVVRDSEFVGWVNSSPMRKQMYALADSQFNYEAADELLSTFKQLRGSKAQQSKDAGTQMRQQNLKAAAVDTGGSGESSQKVYRRADLIRLRMTDPTRYEALEPEIMAAYASGRVK